MRVPPQSFEHSKAVTGCKTHSLQTVSAPDNVCVAIAVSKYNESITSRLVDGAVARFNAAGVSSDRIEIAEGPGAFELPLAASVLAESGRFAALLCLGQHTEKFCFENNFAIEIEVVCIRLPQTQRCPQWSHGASLRW